MKNTVHKIILVFFVLCFHSLIVAQHRQQVSIGANELFRRHLVVVENLRVGVICNKTSLMTDGRHLLDVLSDRNIHVTAIFSPEHGFRGDAPAGKEIETAVDPRLGVPIYSLYGKTKAPTKEMLENVDVLLFDMQDVGARFYTYVSTMAYAMRAAAEQKKRFVVLDRPNPINGIDVEGPLLDSSQTSFLGLFPLPIRHGLTIGEIARMITYEWWKMDTLDLVIIPMMGWPRTSWFNEITVHWTPPSPNIRTLETATVYPGMCLFEGTNVSEGRGTGHPFRYIGAPWINGKVFAEKLNAQGLAGVQFDAITFTPMADSVSAPNPKHKGIECGGVFVNVTDRKIFKPIASAVRMLEVLKAMYPDSLTFTASSFDRLAGTSSLRTTIEQGKTVDWETYRSGLDEFMRIREEYLIY